MRSKVFDLIDKNNISEIKTLISSGLDVNEIYEYESPIQYAFKHQGSDEMIQTIFDFGNIDISVKLHDNTPLLSEGLTLYKTNKFIIKMIDMGADVNAEDIYGNTSIFYAQTTSQIKLLLDSGADINHQNRRRETALHKMVDGECGESYYNYSKVLMLIENGININAANMRGETPLFYAVRSKFKNINEDRINKQLDIIRLLIKNGADVNYKNYLNETPLMWSVKYEFCVPKYTELLLLSGSDPNAEDIFKSTAMMMITKKRNSRVTCGIVKSNELLKNRVIDELILLVKNGGNINHININFQTPLLYILRFNKYKEIQYLINSGADVNLGYSGKYSDSGIPIFRVIRMNNLTLVNLFINFGANIRTYSIKHGWVIDYAKKCGNKSIIKLIDMELRKHPNSPRLY